MMSVVSVVNAVSHMSAVLYKKTNQTAGKLQKGVSRIRITHN